MATRKKTLYDVLQISRTASKEIIDSAYDARMRIFESSNAPEVLAEKALLREAHGILSDATRRRLYDEKLREEAVRALSGGSDAVASRLRTATPALASGPESSPLGWMIGIALLAAVAIGGAYTYLDHKRAAERLRQDEVRRAEQLRLQEEEAKRRQDQVEWAKAEYEKRQQDIDQQRWEAQRRRDQGQSVYQQNQYARQQAAEERQKATEQRRAEYERQRQEQEDLRRSRTQLQQEQRYLRELESNRGMRF